MREDLVEPATAHVTEPRELPGEDPMRVPPPVSGPVLAAPPVVASWRSRVRERMRERVREQRERMERARAAVRRAIAKRIVWAVVLIPVAIVVVQVWHRMVDVYESRPVRAVVSLDSAGAIPAVGTPAFRSAVSALTGTALVPGHQIELLLDGAATLSGIERDIRAARRSVTIQTYYCSPGRVTERLKTLLMAKAREGITISFLPDGFGCGSLGDGYLDSLRAAGVRVSIMRPVHWFSMHRSLHRSHVRSVVIDSRIGYTGGFGFADKWIPSEEGPAWQETTARFTGPAVLQLAGAFAIAWADASGEAMVGERVFPAPLIPDTGAVAALMYTTRTFGTPVPERFLALSLAAARSHVYLANPYFIPNTDLRRWLKDAARRGVDVRILTASGNIDHEFTRWAARSTYEELLDAGVRLYEYTPSMLHAKTMVVDGEFGTVGSLNLDNVSLRINDEATFMAQNAAIAKELEQRFLTDIAKAEEITRESFQRRPWWEKASHWAAVLVRDYL